MCLQRLVLTLALISGGSFSKTKPLGSSVLPKMGNTSKKFQLLKSILACQHKLGKDLGSLLKNMRSVFHSAFTIFMTTLNTFLANSNDSSIPFVLLTGGDIYWRLAFGRKNLDKPQSLVFKPIKSYAAEKSTYGFKIQNDPPIVTTSRIAVIGGGWFGCHTAAEIKKCSPHVEVVLFEKNENIFSEVSGKFGIRLHCGPHYPRSPHTRVACHQGFDEFLQCYPELANEHLFSDYAHGLLDWTNQPPKVTREQFKAVCEEFGNGVEIDPKERNYAGVDYVVNLQEPSLIIGQRLRQYFHQHLTELGVTIRCNFNVQDVTKVDTSPGVQLCGNGETHHFDHVINATCFASLVPPQLGNLIEGQVRYHVITALNYECTMSPLPEKPISFIVMDGSFPCLMPYDDRLETDNPVTNYILTHGDLTILGNYDNASDAQSHKSKLTDEFMEHEVRLPTEAEMERFWPAFSDNFKYCGWTSTVLAKIDCPTAFRSAITFQEMSSGMVYIFPGKINNIFQSAREAISLIGLGGGRVREQNGFAFVEGGILDSSLDEIGTVAAGDIIYDESNNDIS